MLIETAEASARCAAFAKRQAITCESQQIQVCQATSVGKRGARRHEPATSTRQGFELWGCPEGTPLPDRDGAHAKPPKVKQTHECTGQRRRDNKALPRLAYVPAQTSELIRLLRGRKGDDEAEGQSQVDAATRDI